MLIVTFFQHVDEQKKVRTSGHAFLVAASFLIVNMNSIQSLDMHELRGISIEKECIFSE